MALNREIVSSSGLHPSKWLADPGGPGLGGLTRMDGPCILNSQAAETTELEESAGWYRVENISKSVLLLVGKEGGTWGEGWGEEGTEGAKTHITRKFGLLTFSSPS